MASAPGRRELRFKPQCMKPLSLRAQFENMPMGDCWEEARLWEPIEYLFKSKKLRSGHFISLKSIDRHCNFRVGCNSHKRKKTRNGYECFLWEGKSTKKMLWTTMLIVVAPHDGPKLADSIAFLKHIKLIYRNTTHIHTTKWDIRGIDKSRHPLLYPVTVS